MRRPSDISPVGAFMARPKKIAQSPNLFPNIEGLDKRYAPPEPRSGSAPTWTSLRPAETLVPVFEEIRAYLAANAHGITRDDAILEELSKLLHAKVHDEAHGERGHALRFFVSTGEPAESTVGRVQTLYAESLEGQVNGNPNVRTIALDPRSLAFAVSRLQGLRLTRAGRDVVGEAYESLIFPTLRGGQGQFFTPKNVGACLVDLVGIQDGDRVIDPACGPGGFLAEAAHLAATKGVTAALFGVDKDDLLVRLASDSLGARGISAKIACANSLLPFGDLPAGAGAILRPGSFDVVVTNPPFGSKIPVTGPFLDQYDLAHRWTYSDRAKAWVKKGDVRDSVPPQVLFVERCLNLLKEGGRCGIVLPEGVLGNQSLGYIRRWLIDRADILAVVDCPLETFMPSTSTKTVLLVFQRRAKPVRPRVFMAVAEKCGHDRRGNPVFVDNNVPDDDFPRISAEWHVANAGATR
jgi:type I restriction enzyme M protein